MKTITPFRINIDQAMLDDLLARLTLTRWPDAPADPDWSYGTDPDYLHALVQYWQDEYNWRANETALNQLPQYKVNINGQEIHFIYAKGKGNQPKPLILTHGWPDSFYRFAKVVPMLSDPAAYGLNFEQSFDVIVPSLPGFGFSGHQALAAEKTADIWYQLMTDILGYQTFYAAGGDLGTAVTMALANKYPSAVKGLHLTDVGYPTGIEDESSLSTSEKAFVQACLHWEFTEGGYNIVQSTKPQTLGYALNDSPVGLASWMLEKFYTWSDNKGNIENSFTKDELLTHIMIYWVTQTINPSIHTYAENMRALFAHTSNLTAPQRVAAPTAVALFPKDTVLPPRDWAARRVNLQRFTTMEAGGHFAAFEQPVLWTTDVQEFFFSLKEK
ncbi:epoxide hydrolase family protein [Chitinophaga sp. 30R24]|uniref:epoxide hydrolase family protein n=1 Tax=Chitinophaga sp. 30R24 TaxID=3248838 RepID=UPI003B8EB472